ncbi:MAG TPA: transporter [Candidatus Paceibacterota bacterium]|nr:transporter [Verrucomicrobiota bacterium]HSA12351.1 transporter [Candidatus Paceibacterota bacterium]
MKKQLPKLVGVLLIAGLFAFPTLVPAQPVVAGHYPAGAEGIKGASLPPLGVYIRDYNFFYSADRFRSGPPNFDVLGYINAPRVIWMTPLEILGATYGMDVIVPFGYLDYRYLTPAGQAKDTWFGLGDIQVEPLLLSWHFKQIDLSGGYAFWAPTGDYSTERPDLIVKGLWSHMLTLGGVWYPDESKTWAISLLNRYEFLHVQDKTDIDPGQVFTLEWGLSKGLSKTVDVGLIGYYQQQTTVDHGANRSSNNLDRKVGIGPEISAFWPTLGLFTSVRYAYEFAAVERPEGHLVTLTLTKRF